MWFSKRETTIPAPFIVATTGQFDGSDGKWSTFQIDVGTPPQSFRVTVSSIGNAIWVPDALGACTPPAGDTYPSNCSAIRGVELFNGGRSLGFQRNASDTYTEQGGYELSLSGDLRGGSMPEVFGDQLYHINATYGTDTVSLDAANSDAKLSQGGLAIGSYADIFDFTVGSLGLGLGSLDLSGTSYNTFMTSLYNASKIPSLSWSYTAGASYQNNGYQGSLILGGYDTTRFRPSNVTFQMPPSTGRSLLDVSVRSIGITFNNGTRILPTSGSDGSTNIFNATLDSTLPYLYLPGNVVDQLVSTLNLRYDGDNDIYLFNGRNGQLSNDIASFEFTLTDAIDGSNSSSITLPREAFALNATFPLATNSTPYFPIRKANNDINIIGRVFFQEAYVIADFQHGTFSVAQAEFPNPPVAAQVVTINNGTTGNDNSGSSGLSGGAIAGIVIGVLAAVALIGAGLAFLWLRKRKEQRALDEQAAFTAAEEEKARQAAKERRETISTMLSQDTAVSYEMDARGVVGARPAHLRHISELSSDSENERVRKMINSPDTVFELPDSSAWESNEQRLMNSPHVPSPMLSATEGTISEAPDNQSESAGVVSPTSPTPSQRVVSDQGIDSVTAGAPSEDGRRSPGER